MSQRKSKYANAVAGINTHNSVALRRKAGQTMVKLAFNAKPQIARRAREQLAKYGVKLCPIGQ